jgi:hypothetical protein
MNGGIQAVGANVPELAAAAQAARPSAEQDAGQAAGNGAAVGPPMPDVAVASDLEALTLSYRAGGVSLVPCSAKTKQPDPELLPRDEDGKATWKPYQTEPATEQTIRGWFARGCKSAAGIGGKVSGGLLVIDFDEARFYSAWRELVGSLAHALPVQRTGRAGGGFQVWLRCPEPGRNDKLAWLPDETEESGRRIAIETRGEGGYAVMPGSLHPSGRRYEALAGDFANIPTVPQAQADALLAAARKLDEAPLTRQQMEAREKAARTCNKHRAASDGETSVIDTYNASMTIDAALEAYGYTKRGPRYVRPGGKTASVVVDGGRSFHHSANDVLSDGYWHRPFDVFCQFAHGGDCRAAVKAAAELLGLDRRSNGEPAGGPTGGGGEGDRRQGGWKPVEFRRITCAELDAADYALEYLIDGALVAGQPCILAGGKKTLKTSLLIDLGISLAVGGCFLGRLKVNRACRVGIMTGESGLATLQETSRRIAAAAGFRLADIGGLVFSEDLPQFGSVAHQEALRRFITDDELEVLAVDPAYMCLPDVDAANLFQVGERLRGVSRVCQDTGALLLLAHHTKKTKTDPFSAPELEDIAWAGFQEFCRQWLLVGRREPYQPGTGVHSLWLSAGGSAGHSGLWAVDVAEGTRETPGGRFWQVNVMRGDEARQQVADRKQQAQREKAAETLEADRREIVGIVAKAKTPPTKTALRDHQVSFGHGRFERAFASLTNDGTLQLADVTKGNNRDYHGWKLREATEET